MRAIASTRAGIAEMPSTMRMTIRSGQPPTNPMIIPTLPPSTKATAVASNPAIVETLAPSMRRLKVSRPR